MQELRDELRQSGDKRDKGYVRRKTVLKKIVANMTMGNDSMSHLVCGCPTKAKSCVVSPLFQDMVFCMQIQVLDIKKSEFYPRSEARRWPLLMPFSGLLVLGQLRESTSRGNHQRHQRLPICMFSLLAWIEGHD